MAQSAAGALQRLEESLGHRFSSPRRLEEALTHPSAKGPASPSYERLEFLGDAVLDLVVSQELFDLHPGLDEGGLTRHKSRLVNRHTLAKLAGTLPLAEALRAGHGMREAVPPSALANALEAIFAAVYLDGGLEAARAVVLKIYRDELAGEGKHARHRDPKSELQELSQKRFGVPPSYRLTRATGPAHQRTFQVTAYMEGRPYGEGSGASKKEAETAAAASALKTLLEEPAIPG